MHSRRYIPVFLTLALAGAVAAFAADSTTQASVTPVSAHSKGKKSKSHHSTTHHAAKTKKTKRPRGQQAIDRERATEIQQALIREHYLSGQPSGQWDDATQAAMRHYQADQGWQNKLVPDSRALIRLGLGPDHEHLLNPESAMTTETPAARNSGKAVQASRSSTSSSVSPSSLGSSVAAAPTASSSVGSLPDLSPSR